MTKYFTYFFLLFLVTIIYDKNLNTSGYIVKKDNSRSRVIEIFNKDWSRKGYIKKEGRGYSIYDKDWNRKGYIRE